jgi:hypothetical protein
MIVQPKECQQEKLKEQHHHQEATAWEAARKTRALINIKSKKNTKD